MHYMISYLMQLLQSGGALQPGKIRVIRVPCFAGAPSILPHRPQPLLMVLAELMAAHNGEGRDGPKRAVHLDGWRQIAKTVDGALLLGLPCTPRPSLARIRMLACDWINQGRCDLQ